MRIFSSIFLITILLVQTFSLLVIQAEYLLNKNYIATNLCINKDKPKMHCNGKCYLARQLKQQESQEQQAPAKKDKFEVQPFFLPLPLAVVVIQSSDKMKYPRTADKPVSAFSRSVFHPPAA